MEDEYRWLDMEYWYPHLSKFTFKTEFVDLPREEAQAIIDKYDDIKFGANKANQELLKQTADKIDAAMALFGSGSAFVKLSTRSPKDVVIRDPNTKQRIVEELKDLDTDIPEEEREVVAIIRTCSKSMKVHNGMEAVEMLCKSERAYQDLFGRLLTAENFSIQIVVREWVDIIPEYEFRGFVNNKSLNGLTQYYKACYVPAIAKNKDRIISMIKELFKQYQPIIDDVGKVKNYVADFAFDANFQHVYLIELNSWGKTASSALFDWHDAKDSEIMHNGPFDFRILTKPVKGVKMMIAAPLRLIMSEINPSWKPEEIAKQQAEAEEKHEDSSKCCIQ